MGLKTFPQWVLALVTIFLGFLVFTMILPGCTTTKKSQEQSSLNVTDLLKEKDSTIRVLNSVISEQERELNQLRFAGVTFQDPIDTAALRIKLNAGMVDKSVIDQYLKQLADCSNEVEIAADGSIRAKGALKAAFLKEEKYQKEINRLKVQNDSLRQVNTKDNTRTVTQTVYKTNTVKRTLLPWYFWIITGGFAFLWFRKQFFTK